MFLKHFINKTSYYCAIIAVCALILAQPVNAALATIDGTPYNVTTIEGSFSDNISILTAQPWWGSIGHAFTAADQIQNQLGSNTASTDLGPFFAYWEGNDLVTSVAWNESSASSAAYGQNVEVTATWAVVVPVPATVWLFGSGLLGLIGVARRKQSV